MIVDHYVIINSAGNKLSSFYSNSCTQKLFFRQNDWYTFSTIKEAEEMISYIREHGIGKNLFTQGITPNQRED